MTYLMPGGAFDAHYQSMIMSHIILILRLCANNAALPAIATTDAEEEFTILTHHIQRFKHVVHKLLR